jgi:hypothetical protein
MIPELPDASPPPPTPRVLVALAVFLDDPHAAAATNVAKPIRS